MRSIMKKTTLFLVLLVLLAADVPALTNGEWQNDGRLALHHAVRTRLPQREDLVDGVEPEGFFSRADLALPYLCRFDGRPTPEEMREDLVFTRAEDNKPYPKRIFIW
jgi:hypothetical protein